MFKKNKTILKCAYRVRARTGMQKCFDNNNNDN